MSKQLTTIVDIADAIHKGLCIQIKERGTIEWFMMEYTHKECRFINLDTCSYRLQPTYLYNVLFQEELKGTPRVTINKYTSLMDFQKNHCLGSSCTWSKLIEETKEEV